MRLLVAEGLLLRHKPDLLQESELVEVLDLPIQGDGLWPRGEALANVLENAALSVSEKLKFHPGYEAHKSLLDAVLAGSSIACWARSRSRRREHVSRTLWRTVTLWVAQQLLQ